MHSTAFEKALLAWVGDKCADPRGEPIATSTPLFATGLLDSVYLPELILLIEELSDRSLDIGDLTPATFHSIDSLRHAFCGGGA